MSNTARPMGARPFGAVLRVGKYLSAGAVYPGDFVITDSSGKVASVANDGSSYTSACVGVAASYCSAASAELLVWDHPDQRFIISSSSSSAPTAQTDLNLNYPILGNTADTSYFISRHRLNGGSGATTTTLPLKALGIDARPDNALSGGYDDVVVVINNHQLNGGTGTLGT